MSCLAICVILSGAYGTRTRALAQSKDRHAEKLCHPERSLRHATRAIAQSKDAREERLCGADNLCHPERSLRHATRAIAQSKDRREERLCHPERSYGAHLVRAPRSRRTRSLKVHKEWPSLSAAWGIARRRHKCNRSLVEGLEDRTDSPSRGGC